MAKMDELFNDMYDFCEENGAWKWWATVKEWNGCMDKAYSSASFTALVNAGRLERRKHYKGNAYSYHIVPTDAIKEKMEEDKKRREIEDAERVIKYHDENVARIKARYEEMLKSAEEQYQRDLEWEAERLEKAKARLENETK
jgi:hypothetical protein